VAGARETIHATAIALGDKAALIRGPSGSGKSDLALRCIMHAPTPVFTDTAVLVADDRVIIEKQGGQLIASPPESLKGLIELRGVGIYHVHHQSHVPVSLVVELLPREDIERFPDQVADTDLLGLKVPLIKICAQDSSAAHKVLLILSGARRHGT